MSPDGRERDRPHSGSAVQTIGSTDGQRKTATPQQAWFARRTAMERASQLIKTGLSARICLMAARSSHLQHMDELTPCMAIFRELAEFVKRGVYEAGGFPPSFR